MYRSEALCAVVIYTIDLKTESVNGVEHEVNKDDAGCKQYASFIGSSEERWSYRLADGFEVYREQLRKARPMPLRLIQTLFGN